MFSSRLIESLSYHYFEFDRNFGLRIVRVQLVGWFVLRSYFVTSLGCVQFEPD